MADSPNPTFSNLQLHRYLEHISYPSPDVLPPPTLATLQKLMTYHLASVPFENLIIHYSSHHSVSLEPVYLYHKVVERGHGGYCMENNGVFSIVLRSLGFNIWTSGAKVSKAVDTHGADKSVERGRRLIEAIYIWHISDSGSLCPEDYRGHMVSIVSIDGQDYSVDVGFGSGPLGPLPLVTGVDFPGTGSQWFRLVHQPLNTQANRSLPFWILQTNDRPEDRWTDVYAFRPDVEFSREDYDVMSYNTSTCKDLIFMKLIICIRTILSSELSKEELKQAGEAGDVRVVGRMILVGKEVKKNIGEGSEVLEVFETEGQRVQAFKKYFGIELTQEEQAAIIGRPLEIR